MEKLDCEKENKTKQGQSFEEHCIERNNSGPIHFKWNIVRF